MNTKLKYTGIVIVMLLTLGLAQYAAARDLIVVASKSTQKASKDWLGFLESKEIPVKLVTPDSFSDVNEELYIIVLGSLDESKEIEEIAKDALTADEFKAVKSEAKMFYKPQAWNVGQKVILILGPDQESVIKARKASRDDWYEMLMEWFDIEETEGFHVY
ncbi:MAG: hypothetical protein PVG39_02825 [Desulfobacteraceae bacterium]|jgi:hypothetical protein